ncbi:glycosyltransferase [Fusobacterium sp. SB021]|uniref:glycosyltransferase n=1 Tax=Fusobacterium sp. SB021 TaxID=2744227 RepID=UPI003CF44D99
MKKVLFYNGQLFMGGIERVAISYLEGLSKEKDLDITLVIKENNPEKNIFIKDVPSNIKIEFIKTEKMVSFRNKASNKRKNPFWKIVYFFMLNYERMYMKKWLKNYFLKNKFDVTIDFDMSLGKYLDVVDSKKIGWLHFSLIGKRKNKRKGKRFEKRLEKYDKIIAICDEMKEEAKNLFNIPEEKLERLYNPFDIEKVKRERLNDTEVTEEDKKYLQEDYMVAVSRLVKGKGREDLIEIYSKLKEKGVKEKLYILGDGNQKQELQNKIENLNLQNDVFLLGQKKNPYPWMKNAKIFLHTSYGEGLPTVFLESMICGTPVIAYDCPTGPKDILGKNEYGVLVKTGNKTKFEEEIIELLSNTDKQQEYIDKFFKEKLSEFSIETIIKKLKEIL